MKRFYLFTILCLLVLPVVVNAASVKTGKFKYLPAFQEEVEETYYYSDDYFRKSGKDDNNHLLTMSFNLALSTFEIRGASYSTALFKDLGFGSIQANDMVEKPTLDTVGTVIAHKRIDGKTVVAIAIRGENYDSEWGNNFIVGESGNAKGFNDASLKVINRIKKYISDNNLDNVKIWIVGYSRAAAIADLTGVYINKNLNEFNTTSDDIYVYTFETPAASTISTVYDNIYVVKNVGDIIPMVYPKEWGFYTNGKIIEIGKSENITTYTGFGELSEYSEVNIREFYSQFFKWLTSRLSRETYAHELEEPLSKLLDIYFSKSSSDREKLIKFFTEDIKSELLDNEDNKNTLFYGYAWSIMGHNSDYLYHKLTDFVLDIVDNVRDTENGSVLTDDEYQTLKDSLYPLLRVLGPVLIDDLNYYDGIDYDEYYTDMAGDYYISDEEMGAKYGTGDGKDYGYDDGLEGNEQNEYNYQIYDDYGPVYESAYKEAFTPAYLEAYELGSAHRNDIVARGKYDAGKSAYYNGYFAGSHGEECVTYDEYFYEEDWMTDEYIDAYNNEYEKLYLEGYDEGLNNPVSDEEDDYADSMSLYHFATLFKNINTIIKQHYPQVNLKLLHDKDSYYQQYEFTDGENQTIDLEEDATGNLVFRCNGDLEKLVKVRVDEQEVDDKYIILKVGSTIVTLKNEFLDTLSNGNHTLELVYVDGTIETTFKVEGSIVDTVNKTSEPSKASNPKTVDNIVNYVLMLMLSTLGLFSMIILNRKKVN